MSRVEQFTIALGAFLLVFAAAPSSAHVLRAGISESHQQIIDAQNRALGFVTTAGADATAVKVVCVMRGTSAWYQGLRPGDVIKAESIEESTNGLHATITFARQFNTYQAQLKSFGDYHQFIGAPPPDLQANTEGSSAARSAPAVQRPAERSAEIQAPASTVAASAPAAAPPAAQPFPLCAQEQTVEIAKKTFQGKDLVVMIDRSGSMSDTDCPQASSRWDWCKRQMLQLSSDVHEALPSGFTLVLFNNHQRIVEHASVASIDKSFQENKPEGGTDTAAVIAKQVRDHTATAGAKGNKLVLVVITDGQPNDENLLRKTLVTVANEATAPNDVATVFLQVGEDNQASAFLEDLDRNLTQEGAKFDIVQTIGFELLKRDGLLRCLARATSGLELAERR